MVNDFDWKFWEEKSMLKFVKNGTKIAVLKDSADEPEGFDYKTGNIIEDDIVIPEDAQSLEEIEESLSEEVK